jgi:hypothetical protein
LPADAALDVPCSGVEYDSRKTKPGSVFVALPGQKADGAAFAPQAAASGAVAIVSERPRPENVTAAWIAVGNARLALALLASEFFGHPSRRMQVVGITGTNGKTTTSYLAAGDFRSCGNAMRADGHRRISHRRSADCGDAYDARGAGRSAVDAADARRRAAERASWKCRRTRSRCTASMESTLLPEFSPT